MRNHIVHDADINLLGHNPLQNQILLGPVGLKRTIRPAHERVIPGTFISSSTLA